MKRLTKKEALRLTEEMYTWIGAEPGRDKPAWPGWKAKGWDINNVYSECFLCEYANRPFHSLICPFCPLHLKWNGYADCQSVGAPWQVFETARLSGEYAKAQQHAQLISKLCHDELARLEALPKRKR